MALPTTRRKPSNTRAGNIPRPGIFIFEMAIHGGVGKTAQAAVKISPMRLHCAVKSPFFNDCSMEQ
jgi:hypothetical protein